MADNFVNDVVVVGSCMIDFVSYAPRLPKKGETIHGYQFATNFGGKGANQCVAAAKLGAKTVLVARVGNDMWGDKYIDNLRSLNVNTEYIWKTEGYSSGIAQINVSDSGDNQIVIIAGANTMLSDNDVTNNCTDLISKAKVVVCQLETSTNVAICSLKLSKGISILNGAPSTSQFPHELLRLPTIFCVNESEAEDFCGISVTNLETAKEAVKQLLDQGCNSVILTLGADGALYATKENLHEIAHIKCPKVKCVDSTGAGDSFIGALAFLLSKNSYNVKDCIKIACNVAADSVTRPGTQISFPTCEILEKQ